jgi:hypothetical protein
MLRFALGLWLLAALPALAGFGPTVPVISARR